MRRRAGAAPPRSRSIGLATLAALGAAWALAFASAAAGQTSLVQRTAGEAAAEAPTAQTAPAPDPKPPPPKPDPRPKPPPPPAPPPPPPPPAPPAAAEPVRPVTTTVTAEPPARRVRDRAAPQPARTAPRPKRTRRTAATTPKVARVKPKPIARTQPIAEQASGVAAGVAPAVAEADPATPRSGAVLLLAALFGAGFLMLGASAVPPRRIPWAAVAEPLFLHRSNLMALGVGAIALAFLCLNLAVLF